ncbi:hypothetical protein [Agriterribacter sp.]|uniref:hypothetical protein n=1 Tax=Agriterribacter sp. TaxID=2821509 RepID=UPI002C7C0426|nr:hypothetical protein [Agriterribacter sp.]HTN06365.1 hypothetical protein [Agriterribacter sp.]
MQSKYQHITKFLLLFFSSPALLSAQQNDTVMVDQKVITLSEIIIRNNTDIPSFIEKVKNDTTFYKAFRNLRILHFTSLNDIRMFDKKGRVKATLYSKTAQWADKGCRHTNVLQEEVTGNMYDRNRRYNYYTPELYASLFFAPDTICGETNMVKGAERNLKDKSGMAKHKEQLKMLFFNPGKAIPGLPFIGSKTAIFEEDMAPLYDYHLDLQEHLGELCYLFVIKAKDELKGAKKDRVVIDEMTTWFSVKTFEVLARNYAMSYKAGVYDFDVQMQVEMTRSGSYLVPRLLRYTGNWDVIFKKRETGVFTATLFDFGN